MSGAEVIPASELRIRSIARYVGRGEFLGLGHKDQINRIRSTLIASVVDDQDLIGTDFLSVLPKVQRRMREALGSNLPADLLDEALNTIPY